MTSERQKVVDHLLGHLPADQSDQLVDQLFTDDHLFAEMEAAERDILDAYAQGKLSQSDRATVESAWLHSESPQRKEKLQFAIALAHQVNRNKKETRKTTRVWLIAAAAVFSLFLAGSQLWIHLSRKPSQSALSKSIVPSNVPSFLITPLQRGSAQQTVTIPAGVNSIQLNFLAEASQPANIRINDASGNAILQQNQAPAQQLGNTIYFSAILPANTFHDGRYTAELIQGPDATNYALTITHSTNR